MGSGSGQMKVLVIEDEMGIEEHWPGLYGHR
jgi:hypothetical protein